ncbi:MAG: hypothetical protein ACLQKA_13555 [Bryobacteraceae bacterium]
MDWKPTIGSRGSAKEGAAQLGDIGTLRIERYKLDRLKQSASPATVNREVALLKHLFNMAEVWQLFCGRNPVRGVKFLEEDNLQVRSLSEAEEEKLLRKRPVTTVFL